MALIGITFIRATLLAFYDRLDSGFPFADLPPIKVSLST